MTTQNAAYTKKLNELVQKVTEMEAKTAALRAAVKPGFDPASFHKYFDPIMESAQDAHDVYHEMLEAGGHGHHH
jgi:hypothetical protein